MNDGTPRRAFPVATPHLVLRPFVLDDAEAKFRLDSDPAIQKYLGEPTTLERSTRALERHIAEFERQGYGVVAVVDAATGAIVGYAALQREPSRERLELVVALHREARGKGLAVEVAEALVLTACRQLGESQVVGRVDPSNGESLRLVARLGMDRVEDRVDPLSGEVQHIYALSCEAWLRGRRATETLDEVHSGCRPPDP